MSASGGCGLGHVPGGCLGERGWLVDDLVYARECMKRLTHVELNPTGECLGGRRDGVGGDWTSQRERGTSESGGSVRSHDDKSSENCKLDKMSLTPREGELTYQLYASLMQATVQRGMYIRDLVGPYDGERAPFIPRWT